MDPIVIRQQVDEAQRLVLDYDKQTAAVRSEAERKIAALAAEAAPLRAFVVSGVQLLRAMGEDASVDREDAGEEADDAAARPEPPRGVAAVLAIMREFPNMVLTVEDVANRLKAREWIDLKDDANLLNATRTNIARAMSKDSHLHRDRPGHYVYRPDEAAPEPEYEPF